LKKLSNAAVDAEWPGELMKAPPTGSGGRGLWRAGPTGVLGAGVTNGVWTGLGAAGFCSGWGAKGFRTSWGEKVCCTRTGLRTVVKVPVFASKTNCGAP